MEALVEDIAVIKELSSKDDEGSLASAVNSANGNIGLNVDSNFIWEAIENLLQKEE